MARPTNKEVRKLAESQVSRLRDLRADKRELEDSISEIQAAGIKSLKTLGQKSIGFDYDDSKVTGTLVQPTSLIIDETKLKKRVGAKVWRKITKPILDREKLETAIAEGLVTPQTVAACSSEEPKSPYIRITEKRL